MKVTHWTVTSWRPAQLHLPQLSRTDTHTSLTFPPYVNGALHVNLRCTCPPPPRTATELSRPPPHTHAPTWTAPPHAPPYVDHPSAPSRGWGSARGGAAYAVKGVGCGAVDWGRGGRLRVELHARAEAFLRNEHLCTTPQHARAREGAQGQPAVRLCGMNETEERGATTCRPRRGRLRTAQNSGRGKGGEGEHRGCRGS